MMNTVFTKDFFINIVNANVKKKQNVFIKYSLKHELLLKSLKLNGFIRGFEIKKKENKIAVLLKYDRFLNASINSLKITSKVNKLTPISKTNTNSIFKDFCLSCTRNWSAYDFWSFDVLFQPPHVYVYRYVTDHPLVAP